MNHPPYLKKGSRIRIVSPAGNIEKATVEKAKAWLEQQGYEVIIGKNTYKKYFTFAGTDNERLNDLQEAFNDKKTDAIFCSRGGYGSIKLINKLSIKNFKKHPKWLVGYSDITIFHNLLNRHKIPSIHAVMPLLFFDKNNQLSPNVDSLFSLLKGEKPNYNFESPHKNRVGNVQGELVGGNLATMVSLLGTKYQLKTKNKILFIEDIDEYAYKIDRMMIQLKLAGVLKKLSGLIIGDFSNIKENEHPFEKSVEQIINDTVSKYDFPVAWGFSGGHEAKNNALMFGKKWQLEVTDRNAQLKML